MQATFGEFAANLFASLVSLVVSKFIEKTDTRKKYEQLRMDIAAALKMYGSYYRNPITIDPATAAQLPRQYEEGSIRLRELGSQLEALANTMPKIVWDVPVTRESLHKASKCLMGLSNSFVSKYGRKHAAELLQVVYEFEKTIKTLLNITIDQQ